MNNRSSHTLWLMSACAAVVLLAMPFVSWAALVPIDKEITFADIKAKPVTFPIPEPLGVDKTFRIQITDLAWGALQHDTRAFDAADANETLAQCKAVINNCSDVIRFVDVDGKANIFFVSDGEVAGDLDLTGVPDLPANALAPFFFDERLVVHIDTFSGGPLPELKVFEASGDVSGNSDQITLLVPAPPALVLIGIGLVGLAGWMRRQQKAAR